MSLLESIDGPQDVRALSPAQVRQLADEIRAFLIASVGRTGGHLGPNLGVVELTLALHRAFDSPHDPILFDVGHQSYVHKIVTGRWRGFDRLKQAGGPSGYTNPAESEHDWTENQHASSSLAIAYGMARAFRLSGQTDRTVVTVIGDGAWTGGLGWEALNKIPAAKDLPVVFVVNDNGRSYTPTAGALAEQLTAMRTNPRYEQALELVRRNVSRTPLVGRSAYELLHGIKIGLKDVLAPQGMFADLGLKYIGPIDGHDVAAVERALGQAKQFGGPVLVHCVTRKGNGFKPAEEFTEDLFHTVGKLDADGHPIADDQKKWTDVFSAAMVQIGRRRADVVAITAAMLYPTGLAAFAERWPERTLDVGIAEQAAVATATGLALAGQHPVVALYSTFLNRAFDQVLMDVALHHCGVTFVLDRAGITGPDGPSHHGMWDMSLMQLVPGLRLAAPRDARRLVEALDEAVTVDDAPTVIRFSKQAVPAEIDAVQQIDGLDVLTHSERPRVLVVGYGEMVATALGVAERLGAQGIGVTVVDPVWALPVNPALLRLAAEHELVLTVEDNGVVGGCGARLSQELRAAGIYVPVREFGVPQRFIEHASREEILAEVGLTPQVIARFAIEQIAAADQRPAVDPEATRDVEDDEDRLGR